jgi:hypothetical protein
MVGVKALDVSGVRDLSIEEINLFVQCEKIEFVFGNHPGGVSHSPWPERACDIAKQGKASERLT